MGSLASPSGSRTGEPLARADPLLAWGLGAFHAAALVAVGVTVGHRAGLVGGPLSVLGTGVGLLLYAAFWGVTAEATRRGLVGFRPGAAARVDRRFFGNVLFWGGAAGATIVAGLGLAVGVRDPSFGLLVVTTFGAGVAFLAGALLAGALAAIDLALYALARRALAP